MPEKYELIVFSHDNNRVIYKNERFIPQFYVAEYCYWQEFCPTADTYIWFNHLTEAVEFCESH